MHFSKILCIHLFLLGCWYLEVTFIVLDLRICEYSSLPPHLAMEEIDAIRQRRAAAWEEAMAQAGAGEMQGRGTGVSLNEVYSYFMLFQ